MMFTIMFDDVPNDLKSKLRLFIDIPTAEKFNHMIDGSNVVGQTDMYT